MEDITFANKNIQKLCLDEKFQNRKLTQVAAKSLRKRFQELRIAETVKDLQNGPGKWHPLTGDQQGKFAANITRNYRIVIRGADPAGKSFQWHECRAVEVIEVVDYH